jgi:hypothetical protein
VLCEKKTFYVFTILGRIITGICANTDLLKIECHSSWISLTITCFWKKKYINLYYKWHWGFRSFHILIYTRVYERCARRNLRTKRNKKFGKKTNSFKLIQPTLILVLIIMSHFHPLPHPHPYFAAPLSTLTITVRIFQDPFCDIGKMVSIYFLENSSE